MRCSLILRCTIKQVQKLIKHDLGIVEQDVYTVRVKAGSGGNGIARYGGVGGRGGSVYVTATPNMSFLDIKQRLGGKMKMTAESGTSSQKVRLVGEHGKDTFFQVPVGVEAVDADRNVLLARCTRPFHRYLIARGGEGGCASNQFKGEPGEQFNMSLHLKLRPNVGLVGFPNAGKSTLMKAFVPRKSIKIASYPFTTTKPQVAFWTAEKGRKEVDTDFTLSIADLPGLIEGASQNRGKGYKFLKHLEYSDILLFVVDCMGFQLSNNLNEPFRSPVEVVALLNRELENYSQKLVQKPAVLLLNKIDIAPQGEPEKLAAAMRSFDWPLQLPDNMRPQSPIIFDYVLPISAKLGKIEEVKKALIRVYRAVHPALVPDVLVENDDKGLL
ncbi:unnamed protein product [Nippostrongylus brasiliensis]|uniref:GTP-binding protein 10 (inferred by orthology to a human protein) n=2 Tax=Nippostrongylus brasiliensis TaxID=27835 RepID=A0A0N4YK60_NIPBR|nr:unnamed protein product [Nippostrongylus brasiliensis]